MDLGLRGAVAGRCERADVLRGLCRALHEDVLLLDLSKLLAGQGVELVGQVLGQSIGTLVLVLSFGGGRRAPVGVGMELMHSALEVVDDRRKPL